MTLPIERARSRKPVTWLTLLGVLLLPAIIGGILVAALQNPTERLDSMTAAIVNLDEPVTIDDQYTPLGRQLSSGLVEGSDDLDSNLTWVISNEDDAADGLATGKYQAVVTIPAEFSAAATSAGQAFTGEGTAKQATISVTTPDDALIADDLITSQIASAAASSLGTMLSEATLENVLVGFTTLGDQIGEAASGALELADGARTAADGAAELPGGASQLADGATQLGSGASELGSGAMQLSSGATELASGLGTIAGGTRDAQSGAATLGKGLTDGATGLEASGLVPAELSTAASGAQQATAGVKAGVDDLAAGLDDLLAACTGREDTDPVCIGLQEISASLPALQGGAESASLAAAGTAGGLAQLNTEATATIAAQLRTAGTGATTLAGALGQLADGVDQSQYGANELATGAGGIASGAGQLSTGAAQLSDGATQLSDGATTLAEGLDTLATGTGDLAGGLRTASEQLPSFSDEESTSIASVIADPVSSNAGGSTIFGPTAIPLLAAVALWFGGLASFLVMRAHTARTLTSRRSSAALTLRAFAPAALLGAGQGVLVALIVQFVAKYDAGAWWAFAGTAVVAGVAFAAVNQALVAVFGGIGRWVSALVGVVAVATGLISTVPGWLMSISAALPTAPAFTGLIAGNGAAVAALIVWAVLALLVTTLAVALRRTTSAKAVLAQA
ncbi:YhgE/Pip domain-containing protein [uncultured Microbacterium sp.]|uniref:YhgE/Pip domain-containing protein n=1 Tax=uncultured Microbacterium sp. TaxID=191216 RepID=UPI00261B1DCF|nr:YhgE/Pip family protein [uncultured Microbacterium sp.]